MNNPFRRKRAQEAVIRSKNEDLEQSRSSSRLQGLVGNNQQMYFALQNFLLSSPGRQLPQLGGVDSLLVKGDVARARGSNLDARVSYETAARIEIYRQNKDSAMNCLVLAQEVSEKGQSHCEFQETMLADMDEVLRISKAYNGFATPA